MKSLAGKNAGEFTGGMVLELTSKGSWRVLDTMGEINMDDPKVLEDFVVKAIKRHPAEKYALDLWNHGAGFAGFGGDYSSKRMICR